MRPLLIFLFERILLDERITYDHKKQKPEEENPPKKTSSFPTGDICNP
jgi:hypothetical protein